MANEDFDDIDSIMSDYDDDFSFDDELGTKENEPVTAKNIAKKTVKKALTFNTDRGLKFIQKGLPEHVNDNIDKITGTASSFYDELSNEFEVVKKEFNEAAKTFDSLLPESLQTLFRKFYTPEEERKRREELSEEEQMDARALSELQESFGDLAKLQEITAKVNNTLSDERVKSTNEILKSIGKDTAFVKEYTNEFTSKFQNKLLQIQLKSLYTMANIHKTQKEIGELTVDRLTGILQNSGLPDVLKARNMTGMIMGEMKAAARRDMSERLYNSDAAKLIKGKIKSKVSNIMDLPKNVLMNTNSLLATGKMFKEMNELTGGNIGDTVSDIGVDALDGFLAKKLFGLINKNESVRDAYNMLTDFSSDPTVFINKWREQLGEDNILVRMIGTLLGEAADLFDTKNSSKNVDYTRKDLTAPETLDVRTKLTINRVIPGYLGRIYGEIRANRLDVKDSDVSAYNLEYDYETYDFKSTANLRRRIQRDFFREAGTYKRGMRSSLENDVFKNIKLGENVDKRTINKIKNYMTIAARNQNLTVAGLANQTPEEFADRAGISVDDAREFLAKFSAWTEDHEVRSKLDRRFKSYSARAAGLHRVAQNAFDSGYEDILKKMKVIKKDKKGNVDPNTDFDNYMHLDNEGRRNYGKGDGGDPYKPMDGGPGPVNYQIVSQNGLYQDLKEGGKYLVDKSKQAYTAGKDYAMSKHEDLKGSSKLYKYTSDHLGEYAGKAKGKTSEFLSNQREKLTQLLNEQLEKNPELKKYVAKGSDAIRSADQYVRDKLNAAVEHPKLKKYKQKGLIQALKGKRFGKKKLQEVLENIDPELRGIVVEIYRDGRDKADKVINDMIKDIKESETYKDVKGTIDEALKDKDIKKTVVKARKLTKKAKEKVTSAIKSVQDGTYLDALPTQSKEEIEQIKEEVKAEVKAEVEEAINPTKSKKKQVKKTITLPGKKPKSKKDLEKALKANIAKGKKKKASKKQQPTEVQQALEEQPTLTEEVTTPTVEQPVKKSMRDRIGQFWNKTKGIGVEAWKKLNNATKDKKDSPGVLKAVMIDGELHVLTDSEGKPIEAGSDQVAHGTSLAFADSKTDSGVDLEELQREVGMIQTETQAAEAIEKAAETGSMELITSILGRVKTLGLGGSKIIADATTRAFGKVKASESLGGMAIQALKKVANPWEAFMLAFKLSRLGYKVMPFATMTKLSGSLLWSILKKGHALDWKFTKGLTMGALKGSWGAMKGLGSGLLSGAHGAYSLGKGATKGTIYGLTAGRYGRGWTRDIGSGVLGLGGMIYNPIAGTAKGFGSGFKQGWNSKLRSPLQYLGGGLKTLGGKYHSLWHGGLRTPNQAQQEGDGDFDPLVRGDLTEEQLQQMQYDTPIGPAPRKSFLSNTLERGKGLLQKGKNMLNFKDAKTNKETQELKEQVEALATMSSEAMVLNSNPEVQEELLKNENVPSMKKLARSKLFRRMKIKMRQFIRKGKKGLGAAGSLFSGLFSGIGSLFKMGSKGILTLLGGMGITSLLKSMIGGIGNLILGGLKSAFTSIGSLASKLFGGAGNMLSGAVDAAKAGASWVGEKLSAGASWVSEKASSLWEWGKEKLGFGSSNQKPIKAQTYEGEKSLGKKQAKAAKKKVANDGFIKKLTNTVGDLKDKVFKALTKGAKKMSAGGAAKIVAKLSLKMGMRLVPIIGTAMLVWDSWDIYQFVKQGHSIAGAICMTYIGIDPFMDEGSAEQSAEQLVEEGKAREDQKGEVKDNLMSTSVSNATKDGEVKDVAVAKAEASITPSGDRSSLLDGVYGIQDVLIKIHNVELEEMKRTRDEISKLAKHIMSRPNTSIPNYGSVTVVDEEQKARESRARVNEGKKQQEIKPIANAIDSSRLSNVNSQFISIE